MSGFTIGAIRTDDKKDDCYPAETTVSVVDKGIEIFHCSPSSFMFGGLGTYTRAQARELGQLLITAADRWTELNAQVKQAEAEIAAVQRTVKQRIKDALS